MRMVGEKMGNMLGIKGSNKKGKIETTNLLLREDLKRWLFKKWC
jgi:hypothetical protein